MRVLVFSPDFPPGSGGIQRLAGRLVSGLARDDVRVVAFAPANPSAPHPDADGPRVGRLPAMRRLRQPLRVAIYNVAALCVALRHRPQVLLITHIVAAPAARAVSLLLRRPFVLILHGQELGHRPRLMAWAVRRSFATVAVSTYTRCEAIRRGAPVERIFVINPGVDESPARGRKASPPATRGPVILTVARMVDRYKGHDVMLDAVAALRGRVPGLRWLVVGDGPLRTEYERRASERGVDECVEFAGRVSDAQLEQAYAQARVFAMPSRVTPAGGGEGFGLVFLEAASRGLPVVAGAAGGALDAVRDGRTGLLVDPEDPTAVAGALEQILTDDKLAERLGECARVDAAARTWQAFADCVRDLLADAAGIGDVHEPPVVMALSHTAALGGAERSLLTQLAADQATGVLNAIVVAPPGDLHAAAKRAGLASLAGPRFETSFRVSTHKLPLMGLRLLTAGWRVATIARNSHAELIHANSTRAGLIAGAARLLGGPPVVSHVRDCLPDSPIGRLTRRVIWASSRSVVGNSRYTARAFGTGRGVRRAHVVYNAVDERFVVPPSEASVAAVRDRVGLERGERLVAVVGQLTPWKGQDTAIRAFARVLPRFPDLRLAIVGSVKFDGATSHDNRAYEVGLLRLASSLGVSDRVVFTGELPDVRPLLDAASIVLMPSWEEPFGRAAVEAMAAGCAVVATSIGGPSEYIDDRRNGILADPRDAGAWADAVDSLLDDTGLRVRIGEAATLDARRRFARGGAETSMIPVYADLSTAVRDSAANVAAAIDTDGVVIAR